MSPLIFNHIPKSAGTSLRQALAQAIGARETVEGFDRSLFGGFDDFESLAPILRATIVDTPEELPPSPQLVTGHYAPKTTRARYPGARHITVLREARSRLLSHWLFWRSHTHEQLAAWGSWADYVHKSKNPLLAFLLDTTIAAQTDNVSLRMLLYPHPLIPDADHIPVHVEDQLLAEAKAMIDSFDVADVIENPRFAQNLSDWLGSPLVMERLNETQPMPEQYRTPLVRELTPAAMSALARRTRLDDELWRYVAERRLPPGEAEAFREASCAQAIARHALLMAG